MAIGMQRSWTVSVKSKSAAWSQRFRIEGSSNGADGTYAGEISTFPVFVSGDQWGITVEHRPGGSTVWSPSRQRLAGFRTSGGLFQVDIETDDGGGGDEDFNDLVLTCSMPLSASDWLLYGTIKSYSGYCGVNPCFPPPYVVIDTRDQLARLLEHRDARRIIEKLYPEEVRLAFNPPFPQPDPPPFKPMLLPTGLSDAPGLVVRGSTQIELPERPKTKSRSKKAAPELEINRSALSIQYASRSATAALTGEDLLALGRVKDWALRACSVDALADTLLRFVEYDRTAAELAGGPYVGDGDRENLGVTSTDEFGNYVYRFSRDISELLAESTDIAAGEDASVAALPDVIIQIMESLPEGIAFETAPYYDIPNVRRINLCIPESEIEGVEHPCQEGRAIQYLGNISILPNPHSELHGDGTVTNASSASAGPVVHHAAWYDTVHVYGCFEATAAPVVRYTWEYRPDGDPQWHYVNQVYRYLKQQADSSWDNATVGPYDHALRIHGPADPKVVVPAYDNIEQDDDWAISHRHRKIKLSTNRYQPAVGAVSFRIQGYDASGEKVSAAFDEFTLMIDNVWSTGDVDFVRRVGGGIPGECALLELDSVGSPLEVRYRVRDMDGFLQSYDLRVWRGSNTSVPISGSPVGATYAEAAPFRLFGTPDEAGADAHGYVHVTVTPTSGDWLGGHPFCAFSFELRSKDRKTNGYGTPGGRILWRELVGLAVENGSEDE